MEFFYLWIILGCLVFVWGFLLVEIVEVFNRGLWRLSIYLVFYVVFEIFEFEGFSINEFYKNV